jgi:hypothetical protein
MDSCNCARRGGRGCGSPGAGRHTGAVDLRIVPAVPESLSGNDFGRPRGRRVTNASRRTRLARTRCSQACTSSGVCHSDFDMFEIPEETRSESDRSPAGPMRIRQSTRRLHDGRRSVDRRTPTVRPPYALHTGGLHIRHPKHLSSDNTLKLHHFKPKRTQINHNGSIRPKYRLVSNAP